MGGGKNGGKKKHAHQSSPSKASADSAPKPRSGSPVAEPAQASAASGTKAKDIKPATTPVSPPAAEQQAKQREEEISATQTQMDSANGDAEGLRAQVERLKTELNVEMDTANQLRAEQARAWQLTYASLGVAVAAVVTAAYLAAKLQRQR